MALGVWLMRYDVLRLGWKRGGQARFAALCLGSGYFWLIFGGHFLWHLAMGKALAYDAALHSLFLGFVFDLIFAHALVIFPAVSGWSLRWHRGHYAPWALLQFSLGLRVLGDALGHPDWRAWGAWGNALALSAFVLAQIVSAYAARRRVGTGIS